MAAFIKKYSARVLVLFSRIVGTLCGFLLGMLLTRVQKISMCAPVPKILLSYPRLQFVLYEFFQKFMQHLLRNEKDIWFTKEIYDGVTMHLDISQYSQRLFFIFKQYSPALYNYILKNVKAGDTFFDIGANAGYFSFVASKVVGLEGKVYSFEPEENNYKRMVDDISNNALINIHSYKYALSDTEGVAQLYINPDNEGGHSLVPDPYQITTPITSVIFDKWVQTVDVTNMRLAKIDVEGFELSVLKGMENTLRNEDTLELICEVRRNQKVVGDYMSSLGYHTYELSADGTPIPVKDISKLKRDFLFSKKVIIQDSDTYKTK